MSAHNNKDPIERLFQKKAEEYDISYHEEDWLKLEKQLDNQDRLLANRRKQWFIAAAVLILFSLLGYAIYQNSQEISQLNEQIQDKDFTQEIPKTKPDASDSADLTKPDSKNNTEDQTTAPTSSSGNARQSDHFATSDSKASNKEKKNSTTTDFIVSRNNVHKVQADALPCISCQLGTLPKPSRPSTILNHLREQADLSSPRFTDVTEEEGPDSSPLINLRSPRTTPNASVGILVGPDLSTAGSLSDFHSPGYSLGLSMAYKLSPNVSIQAGFIRSTVRYTAGSGDYHPPESFWSYGVVADQTIAECAIIDIPVSIKYDWAHFDRSRLFATAGISSYIMLSEDYQFKYDSPDNELVRGWNGKTGTRHWSSNINLSVGYEYDLNSRFSLRAEPFLKLPIREVGWGNVKLYSLGSFISFNYNIY